jgi:hypothetical protein
MVTVPPWLGPHSIAIVVIIIPDWISLAFSTSSEIPPVDVFVIARDMSMALSRVIVVFSIGLISIIMICLM